MPGHVASRRSIPYPKAGGPVHVPSELWEASIEELRRYAPKRSEALVFWGGAISGDHAHVTGLYVLVHRAQGGTVRVTREEARWLVHELRRRDEKLIAQFHSHPGEAYHSSGDDDHPAAFHEGLLSIVAPDFAADVATPVDCAVHEYTGGHFRLLPEGEVRDRIRLRRSIARLRPTNPVQKEKQWLTTLVSMLKQKLIGRTRR